MLIIKWKYGTDTVTYKSYSGTVKDWVDENIIKPKKEAFIKSGAECVCEVQATPDSLRDYVVFVGLSIALGKRGGVLVSVPGTRFEFDDYEAFLFSGPGRSEVDLAIHQRT